mmetsp:Transcript_23896/g.23653  ORF Transcript_23896/g.23653 Transcript_23896/m.23653 type:complete len:96 (+) Transcript_23896:136-423(+)
MMNECGDTIYPRQDGALFREHHYHDQMVAADAVEQPLMDSRGSRYTIPRSNRNTNSNTATGRNRSDRYHRTEVITVTTTLKGVTEFISRRRRRGC